MAKIVKFWHQWSWAYHICVSIFVFSGMIVTYQMTTQANAKEIASLQDVHTSENMSVRMAVQENITKEINNRLDSIETVQGKIFDRINQIADREK